jgi:hypothetical protein
MGKVRKPRDLKIPKTDYPIGTCFCVGPRREFSFSYQARWVEFVPPALALDWLTRAIAWMEEGK